MSDFLFGMLETGDIVGNVAKVLFLCGHGGNDVLHFGRADRVVRGLIDPLSGGHLDLCILKASRGFLDVLQHLFTFTDFGDSHRLLHVDHGFHHLIDGSKKARGSLIGFLVLDHVCQFFIHIDRTDGTADFLELLDHVVLLFHLRLITTNLETEVGDDRTEEFAESHRPVTHDRLGRKFCDFQGGPVVSRNQVTSTGNMIGLFLNRVTETNVFCTLEGFKKSIESQHLGYPRLVFPENKSPVISGLQDHRSVFLKGGIQQLGVIDGEIDPTDDIRKGISASLDFHLIGFQNFVITIDEMQLEYSVSDERQRFVHGLVS